MPKSYLKKMSKQDNKRQKIITGKKRTQVQFGSFKGAPEPSRDLFVFRVDPNTDQADLFKFVQSQSVQVRGLSLVSHKDAVFKSFKLTVGLPDLETVFDNDFWPTGVHVRRYIPPRSQRGQQK
jgi:hypothetical protein